MSFDKRQTNIAKGVAVLLLLWHHVFSNSEKVYSSITPWLFYGDAPLVCFISLFCKVCVAIFCILTGYGLLRSFSSYEEKNSVNGKLPLLKQLGFVKNHFLNLMSKYWFVYIVFGLLGIAVGASRFGVYEGSAVNAVIDFFGLAALFSTPTINVTWWFMWMIIVFYIIFPILYKLFSYSAELVVALSFLLLILPPLPIVSELQKYQACFVLGMYISKSNGFERLSNKVDSLPKGIMVAGISVLAFAYMRNDMYLGYKFDAIFGFTLILLSFLVLSRIPVLNKVLEELGRHSAVMFMSHTFIYLYYFRDFIYWFKYPVLIYVVLALVSYGAAKLVDFVIKLIRYDKLFKFITSEKKKA